MADDDEQSVMTDELTSDCHSHSITSCAAGAKDTLTADSSDVLAMPT